MGGEKWRTCTNALGILWTVGGRLRAVYNGSKSEEERRSDRRATWIRLTVFTISVVAFITIDSYGSLAEVAAAAARGARLFRLTRTAGHG